MLTEWGVVLVIIALIGLLTAVLTPIVKLNNTITRLNVMVDGVCTKLTQLATDNNDSHRRLWEHNDVQDSTLQDHETRIKIIERT